MYCALGWLTGDLCIAGNLQIFPSWSLERQAGGNEKRKKAGGGHYFLMGFFDIFSFCLGRRDKGDRGKRENENE